MQLLGRVGAEPKVISGESSENDASREWTMVTFKLATNHPYYEEGVYVVQTDVQKHVHHWSSKHSHNTYCTYTMHTQHNIRIQLLTCVRLHAHIHTPHTVAACMLLRCNNLPETSATLTLPPCAGQLSYRPMWHSVVVKKAGLTKVAESIIQKGYVCSACGHIYDFVHNCYTMHGDACVLQEVLAATQWHAIQCSV